MTLAAFHRLCPECGANQPTGRDGFCNECRSRYADGEPDAATALIRDLYQLVHQYRNDLLYPSAADSRERRIAAIVALEQRAQAAEQLLTNMMVGSEMMSQALGEANETFGYLHACMFGAEQHLRVHGWLLPKQDDQEEMPF